MSIAIIISIIVASVSFLASIVNFFVMQAKQNMKIASIEERVVKIESRASKNTHYQVETEKAIIEIKTMLATTLNHISDDITELKNRGA